MDNTEVTYDATPDPNVWKYTPVKYWPGKVDGTNYGRVTFFALGGLAKGDMAITYDASHLPVFSGYTTPAAATAQKDLVAAVKFEQFWSTDKKVSFTFKHILSKIGFTAKLANTYPGATVKVTDLQVVYADNKVTNTGTYAFDTTKGATDDADELGSWTSSSTFPSDNSGKLFAASDIEVTSIDSDDPDDLNDTDRFLMLIPQTTTDVGDLTVKLTYTITVGTETVTYPVAYKIPANTTYAGGTQYTYNFTFTLNPVVFDPANIAVDTWTTSTNVPL
jgi:hypothetical protein